MANFRVRYRDREFEVEIESTDKAYVNSKLHELLEARQHRGPEAKGQTTRRQRKKPKDPEQEAPEVDVPAIVDAISESDDYDAIDKHVLSKSNQLARVLLCLKFASAGSSGGFLSTSVMETITDQLGVRVRASNAASTIKANQKFFSNDGVRRKGAKIKYKLNRKGHQAFDALLKG